MMVVVQSTKNRILPLSVLLFITVSCLGLAGCAGTVSGNSGKGTPTAPPSAPTISGVTANSITTTGATITWNTDVPATSQVEYGTTTAYGTSTAIDSSLVSSHSVPLTGLTINTLYHYRVHSKNSGGVESISGDFAFSTNNTKDTTPPTVAITSPVNGATVTGTISVTANASDNVGVTGVQFLLDGNNLGAQISASPYQVVWATTTIANGTHTLSAKAFDAAGNVGNATPITVTVSNPTSALTPEQDFQNRCNAPGVTACFDFSQAAFYTPWASGNYTNNPQDHILKSTAGAVNIVLDNTTFTSNGGSMRIDCPAAETGADCSGGFYTYLGGGTGTGAGATQADFGFGAGQNPDLYMQFRYKVNPTEGATDWSSAVGSGAKHWDLYNYQAGSCSSAELTQVANSNTSGVNALTVYGQCGSIGYYIDGNGNWDGGGGGGLPAICANSPCIEQGKSGGQYDCVHAQWTNCFGERDSNNAWYTQDWHLHFAPGGSGTATNTAEGWITPSGQFTRGGMLMAIEGKALFSNATTSPFNVIVFELYMTRRCATTCNPPPTTASMWISEFIVSTQPIAVPQTLPEK